MLHKIFIIAGEPSGDLIGANLMKALQLLSPTTKFYGVGGDKMMAQGLSSLFPIKEISVMGYIEILPKIFKIKKLIRKTYENILEIQPDIIITIDSPGFNLRVVELVRKKIGHNIKIINYVAPSIWAYKPKRIYKVKELYDHQLLIFPFEKAYFDAVSMPSTYIGHPLLEQPPLLNYSKEQSFHKHNIPLDHTLITIMPGSRISEVKRHIPIFLQSLVLLKKEIKNFAIFIPTFPHLKGILKLSFLDLGVPIVISDSLSDKEEMLAVSDVALVKSGSSTLELMRYKLPMIVAYRVSTITAFILQFFIKTKFFALSNIILNEGVVPEFIQAQCRPHNIKNGLQQLINNKSLRLAQQEKFEVALNAFNTNSGMTKQELPSIIAAKKIIEYLD